MVRALYVDHCNGPTIKNQAHPPPTNRTVDGEMERNGIIILILIILIIL